MSGSPMPLLLVEDDKSECRRFLNCANHRTDIAFVGITGDSDEGMRFVRNRLPEGIILDLELNWGKGSGIDFLKELSATNLTFRPIVVVTTRNRSELVRESLHQYGVEWVFCKTQQNYSPNMVISHLLTFRPFLHTVDRSGVSEDLDTLEKPEDRRMRFMQRIDAELSIIGIPSNYKGAPYLREAIYLLLGKQRDDYDTVIYEVADMFKNGYNNIIRNMQSAVNKAWKNGDPETLEMHYRAYISSSLGVPSPTEFIHYYADLIRRSS